MDKVKTMNDLYEEIKALEALELIQKAQIKELSQVVLNNLKPSALIKDVFSEMASAKSIKKIAINNSIGIGAGMLIKKLIGINSPGLLRKLTGFVMQVITTKMVAKKAPILINKIVNS